VQGRWNTGDCVTPGNGKYALPIALNIYGDNTGTDLLASTTQTFNVSYRPSDRRQQHWHAIRHRGWGLLSSPYTDYTPTVQFKAGS
jgi:hypothetical protein